MDEDLLKLMYEIELKLAEGSSVQFTSPGILAHVTAYYGFSLATSGAGILQSVESVTRYLSYPFGK